MNCAEFKEKMKVKATAYCENLQITKQIPEILITCLDTPCPSTNLIMRAIKRSLNPQKFEVNSGYIQKRNVGFFVLFVVVYFLT